MDEILTVPEAIAQATAELRRINHKKEETYVNRPGMKEKVAELIKCLRSAMYPTIFGDENSEKNETETVHAYLSRAAELMRNMMFGTVPDLCEQERLVSRFMAMVPSVCGLLATDIRALYDGDPAATSEEEIMLAYPGFEAISVYRLAHEMYRLGVPLLPRMMTEYAHQLTGIDIHPGASIGPYFFIDHGTGVVIGETCTIGDHVKLYQGVTLGAKSFELDEHGNPVKGTKRHPDIGSHVVIYAGATILGGNTTIGDHCVIGGNVWLTHSVEPGQTVYYSGK